MDRRRRTEDRKPAIACPDAILPRCASALMLTTAKRMNRNLLQATAVAATLVAASAVRAQEDSTVPDVQAPPTVKLEPTEREMRNRLGVGYLMGLNMRVD